MEATFDYAMPKLLLFEGGWSNHPEDPGGATMKGVIQRVYDGYRQLKKLPKQSVRLISTNELFDIYRKQYWDAIKGDALPQGVDYVVFDGSVNSGPAQSIKWLQRALGVVADGVIGEATLAAVRAVNDHDALIAKIIERRNAFLRALKTFKTFGKGWMSRTSQVLKIGQAWAFGSVGPEPVYFSGMEKKAVIADAKPPLTKGAADAATGGGLTGITVTGAINEAKETLSPLAGGSEFVAKILAVIAVASVLATIAGIAYRFYAKKKDAERNDALDLGVQTS